MNYERQKFCSSKKKETYGQTKIKKKENYIHNLNFSIFNYLMLILKMKLKYFWGLRRNFELGPPMYTRKKADKSILL